MLPPVHDDHRVAAGIPHQRWLLVSRLAAIDLSTGVWAALNNHLRVRLAPVSLEPDRGFRPARAL